MYSMICFEFLNVTKSTTNDRNVAVLTSIKAQRKLILLLLFSQATLYHFLELLNASFSEWKTVS